MAGEKVEGEKKVEEKSQEKPPEKKELSKEEEVTLSKEQYSGLLDRISELEDEGQKKPKDLYTLDELAEEGAKRRGKTKEKEEEPDWDNLSNKELVQMVVEAVNKAGLGLQTEIESIKVMREIDKAESKHDDFWKYEDEIRKVAIENPSLSIEKAYRLAKAEVEGEEKEGKKEKGEGKEEVGEKKTKTEKLLNLPPRIPPGERTGVVSSSTKGSVKTLREAALKSWDEIVGKDKTEV